MYNGLGDSIWVGSNNKAAAAKWVEFLGSAECQDIVGEAGAVFPAIPSGTDKAEAAFKAKGVDVTAFLVHVEDEDDLPVPDHRQCIPGHRHHGARDGRRGGWEVGAVVTDGGEQPGQRAVRLAQRGLDRLSPHTAGWACRCP